MEKNPHAAKSSKGNKMFFVLQKQFVGTKSTDVTQYMNAVEGTPTEIPHVGNINTAQKALGRTHWLHKIILKQG